MLLASFLRQNIDHLNFNTTQSGHFIEDGIQLELFQPTDLNGQKITDATIKNQWSLLYIEPEFCDIDCQQIKYMLDNLHKALGRDQVKMQTLVVSPSSFQFYKALASEYEKIHLPYHLLLMNPENKLVLGYEKEADLSGVLKDARKLIKNSRSM